MDFMLEESTTLTSRARAQQVICTHHPRPLSSSSSSDEEEDMANCLIMLAQSASPLNDDKSDIFYQKTEKLKIRSVTEIAATTDGGHNLNIQSYECKTCNRTFPSFQALGGHRASHKKPKLTVDDKPEHSKDDHQPKVLVVYEENKTVMNNKLPSPVHKTINQTKVHQCSICGSEFLSGQALGGHMRRHRTPPPSIISPTEPKPSPEVGIMNDHVMEKSPVLSLDLNLPPPEVVDDNHSSFQFTASSSQQPLVFSASALVDCHY